jgi:hypothetical protein
MRRFALCTAVLVIGVCAVGLNASMALALSPAVETLSASPIGEKTATLRGAVNPNGIETTAYFEYGTTTGYGSKTAEVNVGAGSTPVETSKEITGLSANTIYHYRIVAKNLSGTSQGVDLTFNTVAAPSITGLSVTTDSKTGETATLKASVDPNGQSTTYQFEYGTVSGSYPNAVPVPAESVGNGYEPVSVDANISGLTPGAKYFWRVSATNASGKVSSSESSFTSPGPSFEMLPTTEISHTGAVLNASVKLASKYWFEYGTTTSYGSKTPVREGFFVNAAASEQLSALKPNTLYHYRLVVEVSPIKHVSVDQTFSTLTTVTLYNKGGSEPLKFGAGLEASSTNFTFTDPEAGPHSCSETAFTGGVLENPGAVEGVTSTKMQTAGGKCNWKAGYTIAYSIPTSGITFEFSKNGSGQGFARISQFTLLQTVYLVGSKLAECEYKLKLSGTFNIFTTLEPTMSGKTEVVKGGSGCPIAESVSGKFVVVGKEAR